jgi:hypothetical protein
VVINEMRAQNQQYVVPGKLDCMLCGSDCFSLTFYQSYRWTLRS